MLTRQGLLTMGEKNVLSKHFCKLEWNDSPFCYQLEYFLFFHNVFCAHFRSSSSHNAKYTEVFNGVNLSLIQTTPCCAPPPHGDPF